MYQKKIKISNAPNKFKSPKSTHNNGADTFKKQAKKSVETLFELSVAMFFDEWKQIGFSEKKMFFVAQKYWWKSEVFPNNKSVFRHQESIQKNKDWTPFFVNWHVKRASDRHYWSCVRGRHKLCSMSSHKFRYWKEKVKTCYGYIDQKNTIKKSKSFLQKRQQVGFALHNLHLGSEAVYGSWRAAFAAGLGRAAVETCRYNFNIGTLSNGKTSPNVGKTYNCIVSGIELEYIP